MADLRKSRAEMKDGLSKAYGNLVVLMAEDDYEAVMSEREHLKTLYLYFREAHMDYHKTLDEDAEIQASNDYLSDVQHVYASQQNAAKAALKDMQLQVQLRPELHSEQSFKTLGHLINLPPLELQKYSGEPEEFDSFITTFNEVIGNVVSDPAAKLVRLKSQLTGSALDSIKMCRTDSGEEGYNRAVKILRERFGSPYIVCNSVIERLKYGSDVRSPSDLRTFSDELCNAEVTLKKNNMYTEIDTQHNIIEMCLRLESHLRYEWRSLVMRNKQSTGVYLKFSDFVRFVQDYADIVNDPLYGNNALEDRPNRSTLRKSVSSLPATAHIGDFPSKSNPGTTSNVQLSTGALCHLCLKDHKLYTCYKFRNMPIDQRCNYVKINNLCTLCLSKDHPVSNCKSTYTCKVNNCGEKHSSSLHVYQNHTPVVGNCVKASDKTNISMPTVPVLINGTLQTFALLDTGSSASFCSKRLMKELKLQGANMSYQLRTLHGTDNHCSETVNLHVSSGDGTASLKMSNVLVVDEIPVERCSISDVSDYPHLNDLSFIQASQVDLLIGQDHSAALVPIEVRRGPVGSPFAVLTMMGWSLNGCVSVNIPSGRVTSNLAFTSNLNTKLNLQDEETTVHKDTMETFEQEQTLVVKDGNVQDFVLLKNTKVFLKENLYITLDKIVMIVLSLCFLVSCVVWISTFSSLVTMLVHSSLEASYYASMGGVLLLVEYVGCIVPSYVSIYTVSHSMTVAFDDAREYTRL